jgi:hypothetical protein
LRRPALRAWWLIAAVFLLADLLLHAPAGAVGGAGGAGLSDPAAPKRPTCATCLSAVEWADRAAAVLPWHDGGLNA